MGGIRCCESNESRFHFHRRDQAADESIAEYVAELRRLSTNCKFGATLNDALRDRLVCGMRNTSAQKRLLAEADLTFTGCTPNRATTILPKQTSSLWILSSLPALQYGEQHYVCHRELAVCSVLVMSIYVKAALYDEVSYLRYAQHP